MGNAVAAFFTGLGGGYLDGKDAMERKARQKKLDDQQDLEFKHRNDARAREDAERKVIAEAGAGAATPDEALARQVAALRGMNPERAMRMEVDGLQISNARAEQARRLREEGVFDAMRAFRGGNAQAMKEAFNKSGEFKIDGDVTLEPEERDIKGIGKIKTYNATFNTVGPDGNKVERRFNSHDLSVQMMPYEKALDITQKGTKWEYDKAVLDEHIRRNQATEEIRGDLAAAQIDAATARAEAARARAAGQPAAAPGFDPLAGFDHKKAQAIAFEQASKEAVESGAMGKPMTPQQQGARAQQIYQNTADAFAAESVMRERSRVFLGAARQAKTPEEIEAVRARAAQSGFSDKDMTALDPRFASKKAQPTPKPATPAAKQDARPAAAAGMPAQQDDPTGQRLDAARAAVKGLRAKAPGLAQGREAIDAHAQALKAAQEEMKAAEAAYQQALGATAAKPFIAASKGF